VDDEAVPAAVEVVLGLGRLGAVGAEGDPLGDGGEGSGGEGGDDLGNARLDGERGDGEDAVGGVSGGEG